MLHALARNGLGSSGDFRKLSTIFVASRFHPIRTIPSLASAMGFVLIKVEYAAIVNDVWLPSLIMLVE